MDETPRVVFNTVSVSSGAFVHEVNVLRELVSIADDIELHVLCSTGVKPDLDDLNNAVTLHEVKAISNSLEQPAKLHRRLLWDNVGVPWWVRKLNANLLYFPLQITNLLDIAPKVVAIHNAAPFFPETQPNRSWLESIRLSALYHATQRSIRQAECVIFFAEATLKRVAAEFPSAREKGIVVPRGVPSDFEPRAPDPETVKKYDLPEEFLFSVSNIARYKNQVELVTGYARAADRVDLPPLYLAGKTVDRDYEHELDRRIEHLGVGKSVHRLGFVERMDLPDLHNASTGFVFSSACETAPITVIEALACGSPVACSNQTSVPEICGDAALYFDPDDTTDIADTLVTFVRDNKLRVDLSEKAKQRADRFSWERAAEKTYKAIQAALGSGVHATGASATVGSESGGTR